MYVILCYEEEHIYSFFWFPIRDFMWEILKGDARLGE